jgi:hypothetical protein
VSYSVNLLPLSFAFDSIIPNGFFLYLFLKLSNFFCKFDVAHDFAFLNCAQSHIALFAGVPQMLDFLTLLNGLLLFQLFFLLKFVVFHVFFFVTSKFKEIEWHPDAH